MQELLWKYAEGTCQAAEKAEIEKLLASDPSLREELEMIQQIHRVLDKMEPEQPSMRFSKNVMEALPDIYSQPAPEPLVSFFWKKIFWGAVVAGVAGVFFLPALNVGSSFSLPFTDALSRFLQSATGQLPATAVTSFVLVLFSVAALTGVDKLLKLHLKN